MRYCPDFNLRIIIVGFTGRTQKTGPGITAPYKTGPVETGPPIYSFRFIDEVSIKKLCQLESPFLCNIFLILSMIRRNVTSPVIRPDTGKNVLMPDNETLPHPLAAYPLTPMVRCQ